MPKDNTPKNGPRNASGDRQEESAPTVSDRTYPARRGPGEFGTHGGSKHWRPASKPDEGEPSSND